MARRNERGKKTGQKNVRRIVEALVHLPSVEFSRQAGHRSIDLPSKDRNRLSSGGGTLAGKRRVAVSKPRHSNYAAKLINRAADSTRRIISVEREPREKKKKRKNEKFLRRKFERFVSSNDVNLSQTSVSSVLARRSEFHLVAWEISRVSCSVCCNDSFCRSTSV